MKQYKIIDGKKWELVMAGGLKTSKLEAKKRVETYRKVGYNARLIPYNHTFSGKKMTSYKIALRKK
jgi:hypothetical protein